MPGIQLCVFNSVCVTNVFCQSSFIGSPEHPKRFIISQSPLDTTVQDVWRLVWEHRVGVVIVMTTENEVERWWPQKGHTHSYPLVVSRAWEQGMHIHTHNDDNIHVLCVYMSHTHTHLQIV